MERFVFYLLSENIQEAIAFYLKPILEN